MEQSMYQRLAAARLAVQKQCTKKSGTNKFAGFNYFELKDFLSVATAELAKQGLIAIFNIDKEVKALPTGEVYAEGTASLRITDGNDSIVFLTPTAEAGVKGATPIQNLGSQHTYLKRYLYMNALELSEADTVDAQEQPKEKVSPTNDKPATAKQIETMHKLGLEPKEGITMQQASLAIKEKLDERSELNGAN